jgi:hypothetical protein
MPLPLSIRQPFRQGQIAVGAGWRAFASNFNQALAVAQTNTALGPTIYDLLATGRFNGVQASSLPAGWFDCGLIEKFKMTPGSKIGTVASGYRMAVRALYRAEVQEKVAFAFKEQSRLAWKISTGTGVFNLLKSSATPGLAGPLGSSGSVAVAVGASGYVAAGAVSGFVGQPTLFVPSGSGAAFPAGSYIVCDKDYNTTDFGFVGDAGANVFSGAQPTDVDFIRKTSDYVATVAAVVPGAQDALILSAPFIGGGNNPNVGVTPGAAPGAGAKVQLVTGFAARGGGTTINEFSMMFILDTMDNGQIMVYYPRIAPDTFAGLTEANIQGGNSLQQQSMETSLQALAYDDPLDGETVCSYFAYFPRVNPSIQIQN